MDIQRQIDQLGSDIIELNHVVKRKEKERLRLIIKRDSSIPTQEDISILLNDKPNNVVNIRGKL